MKILHIIPSLGTGGAEVTLKKIIENDFSNEHHIILLQNYGKLGISLKKKFKKNIKCFFFKKNLISIFKIFFVIRYAKKINPDIVQGWMYHSDLVALIVGFFLNKKFFWNVRNSNLNLKWSNIVTLILFKFNMVLSKLFKPSIICCSRVAKSFHITKGYSGNFYLIDNGYDNANTKYKIHLNKNKIIKIGFIARYDRQKGHEIFCKALKMFLEKKKYKIKIIFVGNRIKSENFSKLLKKYNLEKHCIKKDQVIKIKKIYDKIDFSVSSSLGNEGFPNVIAESMLNFKPVIATNVGDAKRIISNNGILIKPNSIKELVDAITNYCFLIKYKPKKWINLMKASNTKIKLDYSIDKMINGYNHVWKSYL